MSRKGSSAGFFFRLFFSFLFSLFVSFLFSFSFSFLIPSLFLFLLFSYLFSFLIPSLFLSLLFSNPFSFLIPSLFFFSPFLVFWIIRFVLFLFLISHQKTTIEYRPAKIQTPSQTPQIRKYLIKSYHFAVLC